MKSKLLLTVVVSFMLSVVSVSAQKGAASSRPTNLPAVAFDQLNDFVNDSRTGDKFIVTGVPLPRPLTFERAYGMYRFEPDPEGGVNTAFFTSLAVKKVIGAGVNPDTASLRITCTLLEFVGSFDVYNTPFATKIEGIDQSGRVLWTANGPAPAKVKFRQ